jgi:hypothetical protein
MNMGEPQEIAFYYNAKIAEDETRLDKTGDIEVPEKGEILWRDGQEWKVEEVLTQTSRDGSMPIYKVYLRRVGKS